MINKKNFTLFKEFQGGFLNCVKLANGSAKYLLKLIINYFPSYRDETVFSNRKSNISFNSYLFFNVNLLKKMTSKKSKSHFTSELKS